MSTHTGVPVTLGVGGETIGTATVEVVDAAKLEFRCEMQLDEEHRHLASIFEPDLAHLSIHPRGGRIVAYSEDDLCRYCRAVPSEKHLPGCPNGRL